MIVSGSSEEHPIRLKAARYRRDRVNEVTIDGERYCKRFLDLTHPYKSSFYRNYALKRRDRFRALVVYLSATTLLKVRIRKFPLLLK